MGAQGPLHLLIANGWTSPAAMRVLATQLQTAVRVYYTGGAWMSVDDYAPVALLDPVSLTLAVMGLGIAVVGLRDSNYFLLVVWIAITFISGQLLTDVPHAAYRAAPLLPALAICAGLAVNQLASAMRRWQPAQNRYVEISGLLVLVALVLPFNLAALNAYLSARSRDPGTGMARLIGAGSTAPIYYLVASGSMTSFPRFSCSAPAGPSVMSPASWIVSAPRSSLNATRSSSSIPAWLLRQRRFAAATRARCK